MIVIFNLSNSNYIAVEVPHAGQLRLDLNTAGDVFVQVVYREAVQPSKAVLLFKTLLCGFRIRVCYQGS